MPLSPFTIITGKDEGVGPIFLITIVAPDGDIVYLTSQTQYGGAGLSYNGNQYLPRVRQNDIQAITATGPQGYATVPSFKLTVSDGDHSLWTNHIIPHGWRGSQVTLTVILWSPVYNQYSTDAIQWSFIGGNAAYDDATGSITFDTMNAVNFSRLKVPSAPVSTLCIWDFPVHYTDRVNGLNNFTSNFFQCPYSPDVTGGVGNEIGKGTMSGLTSSSADVTFTYTGTLGSVPAVPFQCTVDTLAGNPEELLVTGVSGSTWTVERAQWNTVLSAHASGASVIIPYTDCELVRSASDPSVGCMARLGDASDTSISTDGNLLHDINGNYTGEFSGNTWLAPTQYYGKSYVQQGPNQLGFNQQNTSLLGSFYNFVYGTQFVNGTVLAPAGDPNSFRSEVVVCVAITGGTPYLSGITVYKVVVNGVEIPQNNAPDPLFTWHFLGFPQTGSSQWPSPSGTFYPPGMEGQPFTGGRNGTINRDSIYNTAGTLGPDPHGSLPTIEVLVPSELGTINSVQILVTGPPNIHCYPIATAVASGGDITVTFASGVPDVDLGTGSSVFLTGIVDASSGDPLPQATGVFIVASATYGPPGVLTLTASATFNGVGGGTFYYKTPDLYDTGVSSYTVGAASNAVWAYLDLMTWGNINLTDIDPLSWYNAAQIAAIQISYQASDGSIQTHAQFKASFALQGTQQQVLASVLTALGNCCNLLVGPNSITGKIQCFIKQTLADQQPSAIAGSNYNTPVPSITYQFQGEWESGMTYVIGNTVTYLGSYYTNTTGGNTGDPASDSTDWSAISQPEGYYAFYFNETNIQEGTFKVTTTTIQETPNTFSAQFQDEYNGYQIDSIQDVDPVAYAYSGNQEIQVPIPILGAPNFDQMSRIGTTKIAEALYGNFRDDPGGTLYFEFTCNVTVIHLASRIGFICGLTWQVLGIGVGTIQPIRILSMKPDMNGEHWQIKAMWHNDEWYIPAYGQNPNQFIRNPLLSPPQRPPYPWQPGLAVFGVDDAIWPLTRNAFQVGVNLSQYPAQINIYGNTPVNVSPSIQPPLVPLQGSTANTGGTIPPGTYFIAISANGVSGPVSRFATVVVPSGTNTNTISITGIQWQNGGAAPLVGVYLGNSSMEMTFQETSTWTGSSPDGSGNPTKITLTSIQYQNTGLPDILFSKFEVQQSQIVHGGVWGAAVTTAVATPVSGHFSITLTFAGQSFTSGQWDGYFLSLYYTATAGLGFQPAVDVLIPTGGTGSNTVTFSSVSSSLIQTGDVVVMRAKSSSISSNTIGDPNFINSFNGSTGLTPNAEIGNQILIIAGTGAMQNPKTIASNTTTVFTINGTWDVTPDSTSVYIVVAPAFAPSYTKPFINDGSTASSLWGSFPIATGVIDQLSENLSSNSLLIQVATADVNGNISPWKYQPFREIYIQQLLPLTSVDFGHHAVTPSGTTFTPNLALGLVQQMVLSANSTLAAPTGGTVGVTQTWVLIIDNPTTGALTVTPVTPPYYLNFEISVAANTRTQITWTKDILNYNTLAHSAFGNPIPPSS